MVHSIVLCCIVLFRLALYCAVLYLYCTIYYILYSTLYCSVFYRTQDFTILWYTTLYYAIPYFVLRCYTTLYDTMLYYTVIFCYSILQYTKVYDTVPCIVLDETRLDFVLDSRHNRRACMHGCMLRTVVLGLRGVRLSGFRGSLPTLTLGVFLMLKFLQPNSSKAHLQDFQQQWHTSAQDARLEAFRCASLDRLGWDISG